MATADNANPAQPQEVRCFYVGYVYNWTTRKGRFFRWHDWFDNRDNVPKMEEGDQLYMLEACLEPPTDGEVKRGFCRFVRHDNNPPLPDGRSLHDYLLCQMESALVQAMPRNLYGPEKGLLQGGIVSGRAKTVIGGGHLGSEEKKSVVAFSVPGHYFKMTMEELTGEEYDALWKPQGGTT